MTIEQGFGLDQCDIQKLSSIRADAEHRDAGACIGPSATTGTTLPRSTVYWRVMP
ncbi:hypothetical protein [Cupriavidus basilensis]